MRSALESTSGGHNPASEAERGCGGPGLGSTPSDVRSRSQKVMALQEREGVRSGRAKQVSQREREREREREQPDMRLNVASLPHASVSFAVQVRVCSPYGWI